jgi:hypothetical protein
LQLRSWINNHRYHADYRQPTKPSIGAMLEAEIRSALAAISPEKRSKAVADAIESGDDSLIGAGAPSRMAREASPQRG